MIFFLKCRQLAAKEYWIRFSNYYRFRNSVFRKVKKIIQFFYRPTPPIDVDILKSMTIRQFVGYAPNPKKGKRNQVYEKLLKEKK